MVESVKRYIESDEIDNLQTIDKQYYTIALSHALFLRKLKSIIFLLNNGADPNIYVRPLYETPLYHVVKYYDFNDEMVTIIDTLMRCNVQFNRDITVSSELDEIIVRFFRAQTQGDIEYHSFVNDNHKHAQIVAKMFTGYSKTYSILYDKYLRKIMSDCYFSQD